MSQTPLDVFEAVARVQEILGRVSPLHSRLHELAYERGSASADKVRVPLGDPTGELVVQAYAEDGSLTSVGQSRKTLEQTDKRLAHLEREARAIVFSLTVSLKAASPGLPTRGVTRYSEADVEQINSAATLHEGLTDRQHWDRKRWPRRSISREHA